MGLHVHWLLHVFIDLITSTLYFHKSSLCWCSDNSLPGFSVLFSNDSLPPTLKKLRSNLHSVKNTNIKFAFLLLESPYKLLLALTRMSFPLDFKLVKGMASAVLTSYPCIWQTPGTSKVFYIFGEGRKERRSGVSHCQS